MPGETPLIGEERKLCVPLFEMSGTDVETIPGVYLGQNPIGTPKLFGLTFPEGHTFFVERDGGRQEVYCTRTNKLERQYFNHGPGDPGYSVGIKVELVRGVKLTKPELGFIRSKMGGKGLRK